jgi:hypothetical protein
MTARSPVAVKTTVYGNAITTMRMYDSLINGASVDVSRNRNAA